MSNTTNKFAGFNREQLKAVDRSKLTPEEQAMLADRTMELAAEATAAATVARAAAESAKSGYNFGVTAQGKS